MQWMTAFFALYLNNDDRYAPLIWDNPGQFTPIEGVGDQSEVEEVLLLPRVAVSAVQTSIDANSTMAQNFDILVGQNLKTFGGAESCRLYLTGVTATEPERLEECMDGISVRPSEYAQFLLPGVSRTFAASIDVDDSLATNCTLSFQLMTSSKALSSVVSLPVEVECETSSWSEWSDDCACCNAIGGSSARERRVNRRADAERSSLEAPLRILKDVVELAEGSDVVTDVETLMPHTFRWIRSSKKTDQERGDAAEEISDLLNGGSAWESLDCEGISSVIDLNGDGWVSIMEAETVLEFTSVWIDRKQRRKQASPERAIVSRSDALSGASPTNRIDASWNADMDDLEDLLETVRIATASATPEEEDADLDETGVCERTRIITRSTISTQACISKIGVSKMYETRSCNPDPVECPDPSPPPMPPPPPPSPRRQRPRPRPGPDGGGSFT